MTDVAWTTEQGAYLTLEGVRLEYACFGPPPDLAPTIVMLHEGLGCVALWRDFPQTIAKATGWGVLAYSRQGHGASDLADLPRPVDFMTREATGVLSHLLDLVGFQRGVLLGHSDGATISAIYAGSVEDFRVRGLILIAPHFFTEPMGLGAIRKIRERFATSDLNDRLARYHRDAENTFRGWADTWLNPDFEKWDVSEVIDYLRVPVLVIQGQDDEYGTLAQIETLETRSYSPVERLVIDGCGHAPHLEQPDLVRAEITGFLARLERIESALVETA